MMVLSFRWMKLARLLLAELEEGVEFDMGFHDRVVAWVVGRCR